MEKRAFDRPIAAYQAPGDVLICSNNKKNHIWKSRCN